MTEVPAADTPAPNASRGLVDMVLSCVFFAIMGSLVYAVELHEPGVSTLVASFARIVVNLLLLVVGAAWARDVRGLVGDMRASLWWRGVFGAFAVVTSFAGMKAIGVGESSFLAASNGVFVALAAPFVLGQRNTPRVWLAIGGSLVGLFLLFEPRLGDVAPYGRLISLSSGLLSAMAYLMIARAGRSNSPNTVVFYLCIVAFALHLVLFAVLGVQWPVDVLSYVGLVGVGIAGSVAQQFLTRAYQRSPAALNSAVSYLLPVVNMGLGVVLFAKIPDARALVGALIVLVFGVALPFARKWR